MGRENLFESEGEEMKVWLKVAASVIFALGLLVAVAYWTDVRGRRIDLLLELNSELGTSLLFEDPSGRRIGWEAGSNQIVQEIPDSAARLQRHRYEDDGTVSKEFYYDLQLANLKKGVHALKLYGKKDGNYDIYWVGYAKPSGTLQTKGRLKGKIRKGELVVKQVEIDPLNAKITFLNGGASDAKTKTVN